MSYKIDKEIIKKTTKCEGNFKCLETGECPKNKCKPVGSFNGHLWVKSKENIFCGYHLNFGRGEICNCPTRNELYRKYKI